MKTRLIKTIAVIALASGISSVDIPVAEAQVSMKFTAPFISDSGITRARNDVHFITVNVTGFPLEALLITLPEERKSLEGANVLDQSGKEIQTNVKIDKGEITVSFPEAVKPESRITLQLLGVGTRFAGSARLYQIRAMKTGIRGTLPIGTAMIRPPEVD